MEGTEILAYMLGKKNGGGTGCRINITTVPYAEIVATHNEISVHGEADENGSCIITAPTDGDWSVTASLDGQEIQTKDISVVVDYSLDLDGIDIVPWSTGTDEQIVAMLEAAHNGDIDLQTDGGWAVGDVRTIQVSQFTGNNGVSCPSQSVDLVITSFSEYESCGNVLQFDFLDCLSVNFRAENNNYLARGYGNSEIYSTLMPTLVLALPSWLQNKLITFSVVADNGEDKKNPPLVTVQNNKLALRSFTEIGTSDGGRTAQGTYVPYFSSNDRRKKKQGTNGSYIKWRIRTTLYGRYCTITNSGTQTDNMSDADNNNVGLGVAPFGCL